MDHLTPGQLERFRRGEMGSAELLAADEHISACEQCRSSLLEPADLERAAARLLGRMRADAAEACLSYEQLADYVDGALPDEARAAAEAHLHACPRCAEDARSLQAFKPGSRRRGRGARAGRRGGTRARRHSHSPPISVGGSPPPPSSAWCWQSSCSDPHPAGGGSPG